VVIPAAVVVAAAVAAVAAAAPHRVKCQVARGSCASGISGRWCPLRFKFPTGDGTFEEINDIIII